ncbi:ATP-binding cassette domain-containing protein [Klebsiella pneumoniae]
MLLGPSGAGKSSLLRVHSTCWRCRGPVRYPSPVTNSDFTRAPSDEAIRELRQNVGMVFQQYNLWPHLTVQQNLIGGPRRVLGLSKDQALARAEKLLERLRLEAVQRSLPAAFIRRPTTAGGHRPRADDGAAGSAVR